MKRIILILTVIACTGCATPFGNYMKNRGNDLLDPFKIRAGIGLGLHADVEATELLHAGIGGSGIPIGAGMNGRYMHIGEQLELNCNLPVTLFIKKEADMIGTDPYNPWCFTHYHIECDWRGKNEVTYCCLSPLLYGVDKYGNAALDYTKQKDDIKKPVYRWLDAEAGATLGFINGRIGFSPGELLDFVLGIFTIDIAKDDAKK
jgi:hypothetical protein